jgi:hypothetical protein
MIAVGVVVSIIGQVAIVIAGISRISWSTISHASLGSGVRGMGIGTRSSFRFTQTVQDCEKEHGNKTSISKTDSPESTSAYRVLTFEGISIFLETIIVSNLVEFNGYKKIAEDYMSQ